MPDNEFSVDLEWMVLLDKSDILYRDSGDGEQPEPKVGTRDGLLAMRRGLNPNTLCEKP